MKLNYIIEQLEEWIPKETAWDRDNVGLQIGNDDEKVTNILLSLDLTDGVIREAAEKNCNLIITHHPLLFNPLKRIDPKKDRISRLTAELIKKNISLYSAHTNLDFAKKGVSFKLAEKLQLKDIRFLKNLDSNQYKLTVFVPEEDADKVAEAVFNAGGGRIGEYTKCSFRSSGKGTFQGSEKTNPTVGEPGKFETVDEIKLEIIAEKWKIKKILKAVEEVHPYEEIAYDLIPLHNPNVNQGYGAVGELEKELSEKEFLAHTAECMNIKNIRFAEGKGSKIKKVAVCGGAGIEYIKYALAEKCDAFITGDIKYHSFQDAEERILLIDAGHYETEIYSIEELEHRLSGMIPKEDDTKIFRFSGNANPVKFFNI